MKNEWQDMNDDQRMCAFMEMIDFMQGKQLSFRDRCAIELTNHFKYVSFDADETYERAAKYCFDFADAMEAERKQRVEK